MMTKHSQLRIKQRMGYRGRTAARVVQNALQKGCTADSAPDFPQQFYLRSVTSPGCTARLYQDHCFIFAQDDTCITVLPPPGILRRHPVARGKEHLRHHRQKYRLNGFPDDIEDYNQSV